jgi:hypothetical protein
LSAVGLALRASAQQSEPAEDWSFYVNTTNSNTLWQLGCNQGKADWNNKANSQVVLDFGGQDEDGTDFYDNAIPITFSNGQVRGLTDDFAIGYWDCSPIGATTQLRLAMGTCNCVWVTQSLGTTFGQMVQGSESDVLNDGFGSQITVWGANDIETWGGAAASDAEAWEVGYQSATGQGYLDYGSLNGCPPYGSCTGNGWTQAVYYALSWADAPAWPLPEIYYSTQADEWTNLDGACGSGHMEFTGPLDEYDLQSNSNTPSQAWWDLEDELYNDGYNSSMPYQDQMHKD